MNLYSVNGTTIVKGKKLTNKLYKIPFKLSSLSTSKIEDQEIEQSANTSTIPWEVWHRCFSHIGYAGLQNLIHLDLVDGLNVDI